MTKKDESLLRACLKYFNARPALWAKVQSILVPSAGSSGSVVSPSLRCIFFYVTKFARIHQSRAKSLVGGSHAIHDSYKMMLRLHTKKRFDPFCRKIQIPVCIHGTDVNSNVGQLVFLRWYVEQGIDDALTRDLAQVTRERGLERHPRGVKTDTEPASTVTVEVAMRVSSDVHIRVSFD